MARQKVMENQQLLHAGRQMTFEEKIVDEKELPKAERNGLFYFVQLKDNKKSLRSAVSK